MLQQIELSSVMIRKLLWVVVLLLSVFDVQSQSIDSLLLQETFCRKTDNPFIYKKKKHFWRAAGETAGLNIGLWAFDRYALNGHYARISWNTIKANFKNGFDWDNDHLSTNMFAHPYHGSLYFNAGRANGFNFWQSELFALGGSAMWEMFMESEYPSKNDIIATPIGGAALGEVFYRTSDLVLDDRASGGERFGREALSFLLSPMRGLTRILTGEAWEKKPSAGREFENPSYQLDVSLGTRLLTSHDNERLIKAGASARINLEYGDRYASSKKPYDYFSLLMVFRSELFSTSFRPSGRCSGRLLAGHFLPP